VEEKIIRRVEKQALLSRELAHTPSNEYPSVQHVKNRLMQHSERIYIQREVVYVPVATPRATTEDSAFGRDIIEILLAHQRRIEELERRIRNGTYRQVIVPRGDPPCVVCGTWSDDWLCPNCRTKYPWMRP
jgi:hypothetical protein